MIKFNLDGETPSKKNNRVFLKNGRNIPNVRFQKWHSNAIAELFKQMLDKPLDHFPINEEVEITLLFYHGDNRRRDSDNGASSILDTLVDAHILKDDNWQIVKALNIINEYDKENPRCYIEIEPYHK